MSVNRRARKKEPSPKKVCVNCGAEKILRFFFASTSLALFPDGRINTCSECIKSTIDTENEQEMIDFLRQLDKPFLKSVYEKAKFSDNETLGEYLKRVGGMKGKTFEDSDHVQKDGLVINVGAGKEIEIINVQGEAIEYSADLADKWGAGYTRSEYLRLEKFYQDMRLTHEIYTPIHVDLLTQLSYMSVERDRLRQAGNWNDYSKISKTMEDMTKTAGFRPIDRRGVDEATGIKSFSQIFEQVEKKGWRKPTPTVFEFDVVDGMITSMSNYYNRLVGEKILQSMTDDMAKEIEKYYTDDLTPVDINEKTYESDDVYDE